MSNKRIQKKHAKREWERDKSKLIAQFLTIMYPQLSRRMHLQMAKSLWKLERGPLLEFLLREYLRRSPLRRMVPRRISETPIVNWRPITSMQEAQ